MRKTFFFFLLLPLAALSQTKEPKINGAGQFEYSETVTVAGASADQLFSNAKKFSSLRTPMPIDADRTVNTLLYARDRFYDKSEQIMDYKVSIQCMDGKYKYTINGFSMYKQSLSDNKAVSRYWPKNAAEVKEWIATLAENMEDIIKKAMDPDYLTPLEKLDWPGYAAPAVILSETLTSGAKISMRYEPKSLKGIVGFTEGPFMGTTWCICGTMPALFEANKTITIAGKPLPAGRYFLTSLMAGDDWTIYFSKPDPKNKDYYGTTYNMVPVLDIKVRETVTNTPTDKLTFTISKEGMVTLWVGEFKVAFKTE